MRLSMAHWPPFASHLACILVGVSAAHLTVPESPPIRVPPKTIVLALPTEILRQGGGGLGRGASTHALRVATGQGLCRLSEQSLKLLEREPHPLLAIPFDEAATVGRLLRELKAGDLALRPADAALSLPACLNRPRVVYGGP